MNKHIQCVSLEDIYNLLPHEIIEKVSLDDVHELITSKNHEDPRKRCFKLEINNTFNIHLTLAPHLDEVFRKTSIINEILPRYTCKPLFLKKSENFDLFGQEFFSGSPIDERFVLGKVTESQVSDIVKKLYENLNSSKEESSKDAREKELEVFKKEVISNKRFHVLDREFLNKFIFPNLDNLTKSHPPTIRWSTGDLAARNVLVNDSLDFRIIDCEFAHKTHFHDEDWIRLSSFSNPKFNNLPVIKEKLGTIAPFLTVYHLLRQTILNQHIHTGPTYKNFAGADLLRAILHTQEYSVVDSEKKPFLVKGISTAIQNSANALAKERVQKKILDEILDKEKECRSTIESELALEKLNSANKESRLIENQNAISSYQTEILKAKESKKTDEEKITSLQWKIDETKKSIQKLQNDLIIEKNARINKERAISSVLGKLVTEKKLKQNIAEELKDEKQVRHAREAEIDKLSNELLQSKHTLQDTKTQLLSEKLLNSDLQGKYQHLNQLRLKHENDLNVQRDKIVRMENSFSWKSTSFLRFLRRKLFDPFQRDSIVAFDPITYLDLNPDLQKVFGNNLEAAKQHYLTFGKQEGRCFSYDQDPPIALRSYSDWTKRYDTINATDLINFKSRNESLSRKPLLSVIMPVYNPSSYFLKCAIDSVIDQIYDNWELCIVDDASTNQSVIQVLKEYANSNERIKITFKSQNRHISYASNVAANMATGEYFLFLDHDDLLRPHSLLRIAEVIAENQEVKLIFSDEDKIDAKGTRTDPYFKPDWNPELLLSQNYLCHLTCCNADIFNQSGGFREGYEGAQDWDLFLRLTEKLKDEEIYHIPEILYHWRKSDTSTAKSVKFKSYVIDAARKTLQDAVARKHINAEISLESEKYSYWRIIRRLPSKPPLVSILIPTKDRINLLKVCLKSVLEKTDYEEFEIIILDNDSELVESLLYFDEIQKDYRIKVKKISGPFNYSAINNKGVEEARGDIIILLNNDIEVIERGWLRELVSHAIRPEIGCVGAKLLYPDDTIQHAGVILGLGGVAGHAYRGFEKKHTGSHLRLNLSQNYEAVTAACLAVRRDVFNEVGGLDAKNLAVAFNDVDFCIRVRKAGYRNLWTPFALLYHHESASRGSDETPDKIKRFQKEASYMKERWKDVLSNDPTYNPNFTLDREDFTLAYPPRIN